ncbi:hypothetical protein ACRALDRAFT_2041267 [Sodiomyces alcalophilus JCM 7366]|uniref:uncharacterized protein n=1 Tax=Sodiomyces alcalophilus JCM 7366 TaxID=591952 RepID=UPI0039B492DB
MDSLVLLSLLAGVLSWCFVSGIGKGRGLRAIAWSSLFPLSSSPTLTQTYPAFTFSHFVTPFLRRIRSWAYLLNGQKIIQEGYNKSKDEPYEVLAPDSRFVFVSSPKHIKEIDSAPDTVLSLNAAAKHMLQPVYTMNGFNWFDKRGVEGVGFVRTLRTLLTNNIPNLLPELRVLSRSRFSQLHAEFSEKHGPDHSPIYPMIMKITVLLNAASLFGTELARDDAFLKDAFGYVEETLLNAEVVKLMPSFLAPIVGGLLSSGLSSHKSFFAKLLPMAEDRLKDRELKARGHDVPNHADCVQWIMETAPRANPWSAERIIYELMAIWFGSVHILSTTIVYVIHDLCLHPEYVQPIREELETYYHEFETTGKGLPLLDSFIKESARLTPVEFMSTRRRALKPFDLSDGTNLAVGDWACTPSGAIMRDERHYPRATEFNGFRFVDPELLSRIGRQSSFPTPQPKPSKLTDIDNTFPMWGTGRMSCPGRFYASAFMKVIIGNIIMDYDCKLVEPDAPRWMTWRSAMIPREKTMVTFTPRDRSKMKDGKSAL